MVGGNISSEKIDLLIYGPSKPIVDNGFSDQFGGNFIPSAMWCSRNEGCGRILRR